jgi:hypothetical protein
MMRTRLLRLLFLVLGIAAITFATAPVSADDAAPAPVRVHNLKVLSDKVDDMTTAENILKSFVKPGMSDADRSKALWTAVVKYRHQTAPPNEFLAADWEAHDPVKLFNSYGYCMCCCCSAMVAALNRMDGREARGRILNGHSVPEVRYGNDWHMFDASLITYFPKPGGGDVAAVDDISAAVKGWYDKNPGVRGNDKKLVDVMREDGWTGWKKKGPDLLSQCPFYDLGWFPARTHGWNATMSEYDRKCEEYEYGYHVGHKALFSLRPGESLVREAGNRGLHVNMQENKGWDGVKARAREQDLVYTKKFFPDYNGGMVANGYHRYEPDLASGALASGAESYVNLASGGTPALHLKEGGKSGTATIALTSPYVYLGGRIRLKALRKAEADQVRLSLSTNNGRSFEPLWSTEKTGASEVTIDLKDRILRRYAYWLRVELSSATPDGAGLDRLAIENDIQHAPRTLPWLSKGSNTITVLVDGDNNAEHLARRLATHSVVGRITPPDAKFPKQETTASLGVTFDNLNVVDSACWWKGGVGTMTVPLETPGPMVAGTFSAQYRARGAKDVIQVAASYDGGKTWEDVAKLTGPTPGKSEYHRFKPKKQDVTSALLRFTMTGNNTVGILSFRADVTYVDPRATTKPTPFYVTHRWKESGKPMERRVKVASLPTTYTIDAAGDVEMESVTYEMPGK